MAQLSTPTIPSIPTLWRAAGRGIAALFAQAQAEGAQVIEYKGAGSAALFVLSGEPIADLNYAFFLDGPDAVEIVDAYLELLRQAGGDSPLSGLLFIPRPVTPTLCGYLADHGCQETPDMSLMVCDLAVRAANTPSPSDPARPFVTTRVDSAAVLRECLRMTSLGFPIPYESLLRAFDETLITNPNLAQFLTTRDGEPVTVLQLAGEDTLVGVWSMATHPHYQRQGSGSAALHYALDHARSAGYTHAYLIATAAGRPLYEQFGFQTVARCGVWVSPWDAGSTTRVS